MMHHHLQVRGLHIIPDSSEKVHLYTISGATTDPMCDAARITRDTSGHCMHSKKVGRALFEPRLTRSHGTIYVNGVNPVYEKG